MLNISRQEISTTGEVLSQDGLTTEGTIFVEDGSGVKSGLKLGVNLAEATDPTTEMGLVNVRFADRTYAKIKDLKIFTTAMASSQAALSDATSTSISNLETAFQLLEDDLSSIEENFQSNIENEREQIQQLSINQNELIDRISQQETKLQSLDSRVKALENPTPDETATEIVDDLVFESNSVYYTGTIAISAGVVTGTSTAFSTELSIGDIFVAADSSGVETEFEVKAFDTTTPDTKISVIPTNKTIASGTYFKRDIKRVIAKKINEMIFKLEKLNIFV